MMRKNYMLQIVKLAACMALIFHPTGSIAKAKNVTAKVGGFAPVQALFSLTTPTKAPFPSDRFTIADLSQTTGRRVNLPKPDCAVFPSDCEDLEVINTLDGFNLQPRLSIPFGGPIDPATITDQTVFLLNLGNGRATGINQVVWDTATNTLHAESDELLDQHTRYLLVVKGGIRDQSGEAVRASVDFRRFVRAAPFDIFLGEDDFFCGWWQDCGLKDYRKALIEALKDARQFGVPESEIICASLFTTQSITSTLEKIRDQIKAASPGPPDFLLGANGARTVFSLNELKSVTFNQQTGDAPPALTTVAVPIEQLNLIPGVVGQIAFGKYRSPNYLTGEPVIPPVATRHGFPVVQSVNDVYFNLYLPAGARPAGGWPVAVFGHGRNGDKNFSLRVAATMAKHGIATISINAVGHGFGPLSTLTVNAAARGAVTFPSGGRGMDQNNDHLISASEGWTATAPRTIIGERDGNRQTIVDLMQLVRVIEAGVDVDGNGTGALDAARIYYFGFSMGGIQGAAFTAIDPSVKAGVLNSPGAGGDARIGQLSPLPVGRQTLGVLLASRTPSLINAPGLTNFGGIPVGAPQFNENLPPRDQPAVINTVAGAMEIQAYLDQTEWVRQSGDPAAYAPHLRKAPLPGQFAKPVMVLFAKGDQNIPNTLASAILRAGELTDRATFFRNDLAFADNPAVPKNPHRFLVNVDIPAAVPIALGAQEQIAVFFASGGTIITQPEPARYFETPITLPLPESLSFIP